MKKTPPEDYFEKLAQLVGRSLAKEWMQVLNSRKVMSPRVNPPRHRADRPIKRDDPSEK